MAELKMKIARADGFGGFAAYLAGTVQSSGTTTIDLKPNQALVLMDVQALFDDSSLETESGAPVPEPTPEERKRILIESLMHEFGHVLEDFYGLEFDENWIEKVTASYTSR